MSRVTLVYLALKRNQRLVTGLTRDPEFTFSMLLGASKSNVDAIVYIEECESVRDALVRVATLRSLSRKKKIELIESDNPDWNNLGNVYVHVAASSSAVLSSFESISLDWDSATFFGDDFDADGGVLAKLRGGPPPRAPGFEQPLPVSTFDDYLEFVGPNRDANGRSLTIH
jgi:predicted GIY-YIG superfamily endonuclease